MNKLNEFSRLLVVDDSPVMRKILKRMLRHVGYANVDEAADGHEAIELLALKTYKLIVCDWDMAPIDGLDLLRRLKQSEVWREIPFIMMTSMSKKWEGLDPELLSLPHLIKPFTIEDLASRIRTVLRSFDDGVTY